MHDHHQEEVQERWERTRRRNDAIQTRKRLSSHIGETPKRNFALWVFMSVWRFVWFIVSGGFLIAGVAMLTTCDEAAAVSAEAYRRATWMSVSVTVVAILSFAIMLAFWRRYKYSRNDE